MFKTIFFVGIGGKGLNGIAKICLEKGQKVIGVDKNISPEVDHLRQNGAIIFNQHSETNITRDIELVVYSSIAKLSPEIRAAKKMKIPILKRSEFLNYLTQGTFRVSVCGSHGKSTTTALVGLSTIGAGIDASIFGGAYTKEWHGYNHLGKSNYSIMEACEYDRSFHDLIGNIGIITSVEKSHLEYYKDEVEMLEAFRFFVRNHLPNATIIANGDDINARMITIGAKCRVIYVGFNQINDYVIKNYKENQSGSTFSIYHRNDYGQNEPVFENIEIKIPGKYNAINYTLTAAFLHLMKLPLHGLQKTAETFTGVGRRFEVTEDVGGRTFVDDFAHHPTQVRNLFDGIKQCFPNKKVCAVFQPRQYNLIKNFLKEYGSAFRLSDEIILTDLVPALGDTEEDIKSLTTQDVAEAITNNSFRPVTTINDFNEIVKYINQKYKTDSIIATIGAGNVYQIRDMAIKQNRVD